MFSMIGRWGGGFDVEAAARKAYEALCSVHAVLFESGRRSSFLSPFEPLASQAAMRRVTEGDEVHAEPPAPPPPQLVAFTAVCVL